MRYTIWGLGRKDVWRAAVEGRIKGSVLKKMMNILKCCSNNPKLVYILFFL